MKLRPTLLAFHELLWQLRRPTPKAFSARPSFRSIYQGRAGKPLRGGSNYSADTMMIARMYVMRRDSRVLQGDTKWVF